MAVLLCLSKCVIPETFKSRMIENRMGCSGLLAIMGRTSDDIMLAFEINPEKYIYIFFFIEREFAFFLLEVFQHGQHKWLNLKPFFICS